MLLVERVVANLPGLKQVWVCGDLARGVNQRLIDAFYWDEQLDQYIGGLSGKVEKLTGKKVNAQILEHMPDERCSMFIGVGKKRRTMIARLQANMPVNNRDKQAIDIVLT